MSYDDWGGDDGSLSGEMYGSQEAPSDEEDLYNEQQQPANAPNDQPNKQPKAKPKFWQSDEDGGNSDSDESTKRTIRSTTEKQTQEMKKVITKLRSNFENDDWGAVETEWDSFLKAYPKAKPVLEKSPYKFFFSFLSELDNKINEILKNKELLKAMKSKKVHFFNKMKLHWKKFLKEEKEIETKISQFRTNPNLFADEEVVAAPKVEKKSWFLPDDDDKTKQDKEKTELNEEEEDWNPEKIEKKIKELLKERGSKGYITGGVHKHIKFFRLFLNKTDVISRQLTLRFLIVDALFDTNLGTSPLLVNSWKRIYNELVIILDTLFERPSLRLSETKINLEEDIALDDNVVYGHLFFSIDKLNVEYLRSLQNIDPQTPEYVIRLAQENDIFNLIRYTSKYYETIKESNPDSMKFIVDLACKQLDYLYYKHEALGGGVEEVKIQQDIDGEEEVKEQERVESGDEQEEEAKKETVEEEKDTELLTPKIITPVTNLNETVNQLATLVYGHGQDDHHKRKVMLQHVYHLALHDQYGIARDMLLMTHLPEKIHKARVTDQIMFNRALVQLGLAAFRAGKIEDANNCLQDIILNGKDKAKELLAQGITRYQGEKNIEQEKQERSRQIPYHMHINLDLIEFILLVSGMLIEIPLIAQARFKEVKKKILSNFRRSYDFYNDRQLFTGPPETTKEAVIVAAKALECGDWKTCREIISKLDIWKLISNSQTVLDKISRLIQEQGLRTYLFANTQYYDTIYISHLARMFELDENLTHALVSNMMMSSELQASLDQPSGAIVIESQQMSQLRHLALNYAEKANILLDTNEPIDQRTAYDKRTWNEGQIPQGQMQGRPQRPVYQKGQTRGGFTQYNSRTIGGDMRQKKPIRGGKSK